METYCEMVNSFTGIPPRFGKLPEEKIKYKTFFPKNSSLDEF